MMQEPDKKAEYHSNLSKHFLYRLFFPRNIALIGATLSPKIDLTVYLRAYKAYGYGITRDPKIYPVNQKYEGKLLWELWKFYKDLKSIPEPIDLVICAVRAEHVPDVLKECIDANAKFLVIFTSGFSEVGERGISYAKEIKSILENHPDSTRIIGPNCFGPLNSQINLNFNETVLNLYKGWFSFFTQSGGFAHRIIEYSEYRGLGLNFGISVGNMMDLNMNDFLQFFALDPKTSVIGFYLESVQEQIEGRKFMTNLKEITKVKPIVIYKGGMTEIGAKSCQSHTGAIAGSAHIYQAMFKQTNAILVNNTEEFFDVSYLLTNVFPQKLPKGLNICALGPGGGASVEMADIFCTAGFSFPELSQETQAKLTDIFYDINTIFHNPLDLGTYGHMPDRLLDAIKLVNKEKQIDIIVPIFYLSRLAGGTIVYDGFARDFARSLGRLNKKTDKLICLVYIVDRDDLRTINELHCLKKALDKFGVPHFPSLNRLVKALEYVSKFCRILK